MAKKIKPEYTTKEVQKAREALWRMGSLEWKLHPTQRKMYDFFHNNKYKTVVFNCSRRLGKSLLLTLIAFEQCLKTPQSKVKYVLPEQKMARTIIKSIIQKLLEDCPDDLRPTFKTQDNVWVFPNGSEIQLAGTDNGNYDKLRGGDAHLCLVDEAGFCSELSHIITAVLIPTTTITGGRIILSSTTPPNPNHEFIRQMQLAGSQDRLIVKTIYDALHDGENEEHPHITPAMIEDILINIPGGADSDEFRTEYMCEILHASENAIVPEFKEAAKDVVGSWPRPAFCDKYVAMDIGFKDLTVLLFAYYDFEHAMLVIQDELVMNGPTMTTEKLAEQIAKKEAANWIDKLTGEQAKPYLRVSDNNLIVINDLKNLHNLYFLPTDKTNKDAAINQVRMMITNRQIMIDPKCVTLLTHLKMGTWDKQRKDFLRTKEFGHFDAIMALVYLVRNVNMDHNPFPPGYRFHKLGKTSDVFFNPNSSKNRDESDFAKKFAKQFEIKSSFRVKKS